MTPYAGEDVEKLDHSYTAGRNVKWYKDLGVSYKAKHATNNFTLGHLSQRSDTVD